MNLKRIQTDIETDNKFFKEKRQSL